MKFPNRRFQEMPGVNDIFLQFDILLTFHTSVNAFEVLNEIKKKKIAPNEFSKCANKRWKMFPRIFQLLKKIGRASLFVPTLISLSIPES